MGCTKGRTNPKLWAKAKAEAIKRLGGRHSARAMQLAGKLYRDAGGDYCGPRTGAQRKLSKWTAEDWRTASGAKACHTTLRGRVVCDRYLPRKAWSMLSPAERKATRTKKRRAREQYVANTAKARSAGRRARGMV